MHTKLFTLFLLICFLFPYVSGLHRASIVRSRERNGGSERACRSTTSSNAYEWEGRERTCMIWDGGKERKHGSDVWCEMEEERENMAAVDSAPYSGTIPRRPRTHPRELMTLPVIPVTLFPVTAFPMMSFPMTSFPSDVISCHVISCDAISVMSFPVTCSPSPPRDVISRNPLPRDLLSPPRESTADSSLPRTPLGAHELESAPYT